MALEEKTIKELQKETEVLKKAINGYTSELEKFFLELKKLKTPQAQAVQGNKLPEEKQRSGLRLTPGPK